MIGSARCTMPVRAMSASCVNRTPEVLLRSSIKHDGIRAGRSQPRSCKAQRTLRNSRPCRHNETQGDKRHECEPPANPLSSVRQVCRTAPESAAQRHLPVLSVAWVGKRCTLSRQQAGIPSSYDKQSNQLAMQAVTRKRVWKDNP